MSLKDLYLFHQYRPDKSNLIDDFYVPCLSNSTHYQRAVGYFNSHSLAVAAKGLSHFVDNGGKMELIASPQFEEEDLEAIRVGYEAKEDIITKALLRKLEDSDNPIVNQRLGFLAWLIYKDQLDIKIAFVDDLSENGIYHEKIGCFYDTEGNIVAFSGSSNETKGGLYSNFELIEVYCSWRAGDEVRVENKVEDFKELWVNNTKHLKIIDFPEAVKDKLLENKKYSTPGSPDPESQKQKRSNQVLEIDKPSIPSYLDIRDYQKEAIKSWFRNNGKGIFAMATGTGKTITALTTAIKLYEKLNYLGLVIIVPYIELVHQWAEEAKQFGINPILSYDSRLKWEDDLNNKIISFNMGTLDHFAVIMTNTTFLTDTMQKSLEKLNRPTFLIADEAHHLGATNLSKRLPSYIPYRLALSATPKRWFDEDGTESIISYFYPGIIFEFGLKEAIENGYLTKYRYYPHIIQLTEEEYENYYEITKQIYKKLMHKGDDDLELDSGLQHLFIQRARILSQAENKLLKLHELVSDENEDSKFNIFYCGDTKVGDERQIERVVKILGNQIGLKVHPFTSRESKNERKELLQKFGNGEIQGLVAIRCLDEGVDIPATRTAYILASSTNPKEFIQRRGRVLRKYPNKEYSIIHDFIVIPRELEEIARVDDKLFNIERKLVKRELTRVLEFASLAENGPQALATLQKVKKAYNLLDL